MAITQDSFNKEARGTRQLVLDLETTGLHVHEGERIIDVGIIELINGKPTGKTLHIYLNPGKEMEESNIAIHHITNEMLHDKPHFDDVAKEIRDFIGSDQIIITCQTHGGVTLDIAFLNAELVAAGQTEIPADQWLNVRRWSEEMFCPQADGTYDKRQAKLDFIAKRYGLSLDEREKNGHGALLDADLLAAVYPHLLRDYTAFIKAKFAVSNNPTPNM